MERKSLEDILSESSNQSLYQRLGGKLAVYAVVDRFYTRVTEDPALRPYFAKVDMDRLRLHQAAFLSYAFGGPGYEAPDLAQVHSGFHITSEHYDLVTDLLVEALLDMGVADEDVNAVVDRVVALKQMIINR
ncbi:MAG: group I truncated hemoglobin [Bacillota bacterium]